MFRKVTRGLVLAVSVLIAVLAVSAGAGANPRQQRLPSSFSPATHHPCPSMSLTATATDIGHAGERCSRNAAVNVLVNGRPLVVADALPRREGGTFYGDGTVVQVRQENGRAFIQAATILGRADVRVWFGRYVP